MPCKSGRPLAICNHGAERIRPSSLSNEFAGSWKGFWCSNGFDSDAVEANGFGGVAAAGGRRSLVRKTRITTFSPGGANLFALVSASSTQRRKSNRGHRVNASCTEIVENCYRNRVWTR
jgi:hypothetical protein